MTHIKWRKGIPYIYKSIRTGKTVKSVYVKSYAKHLVKGGDYFKATKSMTATQIRMMSTIADNVDTYKKLRRINQKPMFKPYSTRYYLKWRKEFSL